MNYYLLALTAIDLFVLCFMCTLTKLSESLSKKQKHGFLLAFTLIAGISVLELVTLEVDGMPAEYRWINLAANYLGFGLSPAVSLCLAYALNQGDTPWRSLKFAACCELVYLALLALSLPFGAVFTVSADNVYSRGSLFFLYVLAYAASVIYLCFFTILTTQEFQNRSRPLVYPLMAFLMVISFVQVTLPALNIAWPCITLLSVLYFIYCNEIWNQLDALTGLLSQKSYLNRTEEMVRNGGVLMVFDADDFKQVNDHHGHLQGDACLVAIAECLKKAYARHGYCYRIGGDEFCVLLSSEKSAGACTQRFLALLEERRARLPLLPTVSFGSCAFTGEDVVTVKDQADREMYRYKKEHKGRVSE